MVLKKLGKQYSSDGGVYTSRVRQQKNALVRPFSLKLFLSRAGVWLPRGIILGSV